MLVLVGVLMNVRRMGTGTVQMMMCIDGDRSNCVLLCMYVMFDVSCIC